MQTEIDMFENQFQQLGQDLRKRFPDIPQLLSYREEEVKLEFKAEDENSTKNVPIVRLYDFDLFDSRKKESNKLQVKLHLDATHGMAQEEHKAF